MITAVCPAWSSPARKTPGPHQDRRWPGPAALRSGVARSAGPAVERSDCMIWNVAVVVNTSMSAAASACADPGDLWPEIAIIR